jgi:hypothetical protein
LIIGPNGSHRTGLSVLFVDATMRPALLFSPGAERQYDA